MDNIQSDIAKKRVVLLAYDGLCLFEFGIGVEVFGLPRPEFTDWYGFEIVSVDAGPLRGTAGVTIAARHDLAVLEGAHLILIPGWRGALEPVPEAVCDALRKAHAAGTRIASICSGVFVLAASGLLDGKRATTHWRYTDMLRERFPAIRVDGDVLYVDEGQVLTSAGSAAGLDLCLHIVRQDFGAAAANAVARRLVLPPAREGGQRQFVPAPAPPTGRGGRIAPLLDQVRGDLARNWTLAGMAQAGGLSPRSLSRKMAQTTGDSPLVWLARQRVARAADLLETTALRLDDIAQAAGFGSPESFRRVFKEFRGISPSQHRKTFGLPADQLRPRKVAV